MTQSIRTINIQEHNKQRGLLQKRGTKMNINEARTGDEDLLLLTSASH